MTTEREKVIVFKKIVIVEPIFMEKAGEKELEKFCDQLVVYDSVLNSEEETIQRIGNADCIIVSSITTINKKIIEASKNLKHIALCCSYYGKLFSKVDIEAAEERGITYSYLSEYGDNGTVEYVVAEVINLIHGFYEKRLKEEAYDLTGVKIGILGLGNLGTKIARVFRLLGTEVFYFSRTRKAGIEKELEIKYLELDELLNVVDILSINLNRDVCLIGEEHLKIYGNGKAIINTSLGKCYEIKSLKKWLKNKDNYYVCDAASVNDDIQEIIDYENVIYTNIHSGITKQCLKRATRQIVDNIKSACKMRR